MREGEEIQYYCSACDILFETLDEFIEHSEITGHRFYVVQHTDYYPAA